MKRIDKALSENKDYTKEQIIGNMCPAAIDLKIICEHNCEKCWNEEIEEDIESVGEMKYYKQILDDKGELKNVEINPKTGDPINSEIPTCNAISEYIKEEETKNISMVVSIEYIKYLKSELRKINLMKLEDIQFTENGEIIDIPKINIDEFNYCGLSNVDFITGGAYLKRFYDTVQTICKCKNIYFQNKAEYCPNCNVKICPECHNKNICLDCNYHIDEEKWLNDINNPLP